MSASLIVAWLLMPACGAAIYLAMAPQPAPARSAAALGYGVLIGVFATAGATALLARTDTAHAFAHTAPWLAALGAAAAAHAWRRMRRRAHACAPMEKMEKWKIALFLAVPVALAWRGWLALDEVLLRPTYPWDAWDAWAVKSKTWYLLGHYAPFVSMGDWLLLHTPDAYTGPAWSYPTTLAWMQVWFASAAGGWIEPLVNLPWVAVWVALLCAHYGQWRALGLSRAKALAFVYVLGSLPLPTVHVALAGYADLWLATMLGLGVLAWLRWIEQGDRAQLAIALACAFALPLIKLEGAVWLLLFAMVAGYSALPRRRRRLTVGIVAAVLLAMLVVGKLILPLFGLGWVNVHLHSIEVPVLGNLPIGWHAGAFGSIAQSLFAQANWNLLWWIVPAVVVWRWRELRLYAATRALGALLCAGLGFLVFLFAFTDAAQWAESYTAINRLVMHLVPATVTLLALLSRNLDLQALLGRERASAPRSAPA